MIKIIFISFSQAIQGIRKRFFHTALSVLGIIIGVGALVTILSLIDGLEKFANEQISGTTSLATVIVETQSYESLDGIRIKKEKPNYFTFESYISLKKKLKTGKTNLHTVFPAELTYEEKDKKTGAYLTGVASVSNEDIKLSAGKLFSSRNINNRLPVGIINAHLAKNISVAPPEKLIGKKIHYKNLSIEIIGIKEEQETPFPYAEIIIPISLFDQEDLKENPPVAYFEAENIEMVTALKDSISKELKKSGWEDGGFTLNTNQSRVEQAAKGFLVFRIVMSMIIGLSVLVGGIGVMNVLLISVNERTTEIGIRKAMGAKKRDIMLQFFSEALVVSFFGCLLGLLFGVIITTSAVPIIKALTDMPFSAAFTVNTFITISVIALLIGIIFGTFPALKAAKLDPVEAIRRE
jgi:putative ABC transport system permease protein